MTLSVCSMSHKANSKSMKDFVWFFWERRSGDEDLNTRAPPAELKYDEFFSSCMMSGITGH